MSVCERSNKRQFGLFRDTWYEESHVLSGEESLYAQHSDSSQTGRKPHVTVRAGHWQRLHQRSLMPISPRKRLWFCSFYTHTKWELLFWQWLFYGWQQSPAWKLSMDCTILANMNFSQKRTTASPSLQTSSCATISSTQRCVSRTCSGTKPWMRFCSKRRPGSRWCAGNAIPIRENSCALSSLPCVWMTWMSPSSRAGPCARASNTAARPWCLRLGFHGRVCWTATDSHSIMTCAYRLRAWRPLHRSLKKVLRRQTKFLWQLVLFPVQRSHLTQMAHHTEMRKSSVLHAVYLFFCRVTAKLSLRSHLILFVQLIMHSV